MISGIEDLEKASFEIKKNLLKLCTEEIMHIGGDLSIAEVMTVLWQYQMRFDPENPKDELRDRFVLSKGHASAVTYFNQAMLGCYPAEEIIRKYVKDESIFSMHPCTLVNPYYEISTGSLGHGLPIACGIAAALRLKGNQTSRVYVVMGDGEQEEGSVWEGAMNAVHQKAGNLIAIIDANGLQADGELRRISGIGDIAGKYRAFGWNVKELDGHKISEIKKALDEIPPADSEVPTVLICRTIKGHGIPYMENNPKWHAGKISIEQYQEAVALLENKLNEKGIL